MFLLIVTTHVRDHEMDTPWVGGAVALYRTWAPCQGPVLADGCPQMSLASEAASLLPVPSAGTERAPGY